VPTITFVVCDQPEDLEPRMRELLGTGMPVALVIAAVGRADLGDIEVLAALRAIDPTASRVAAVRRGNWETTRPLFEAIATGKVDHWVTQPVQTPDEDFHRCIAGFLSDAASTAGRQMLRELAVAPRDLPVLTLLFGARQATLVNPSNAEIADAFAALAASD
jgi:hypothetical protein